LAWGGINQIAYISEDPIGFNGDTINLYEYAENNPVNLDDPFGLMPNGRIRQHHYPCSPDPKGFATCEEACNSTFQDCMDMKKKSAALACGVQASCNYKDGGAASIDMNSCVLDYMEKAPAECSDHNACYYSCRQVYLCED